MTPKQILIASSLLLISACKPTPSDSHQEAIPQASTPTSESTIPTTVAPTGDPYKDWILVEQAVDAWLYYHLSDFKSYEPLRRSTDYDSIHDTYTHHLRYRTMTPEGGMVTIDQDYEVDLRHRGSNSLPFKVQEK